MGFERAPALHIEYFRRGIGEMEHEFTRRNEFFLFQLLNIRKLRDADVISRELGVCEKYVFDRIDKKDVVYFRSKYYILSCTAREVKIADSTERERERGLHNPWL